MAKGTANMEGDHNTHGAPLPQDEISATKLKLGLPDDAFYFPQRSKLIFNQGLRYSQKCRKSGKRDVIIFVLLKN